MNIQWIEEGGLHFFGSPDELRVLANGFLIAATQPNVPVESHIMNENGLFPIRIVADEV
jgi:hypothetical protein